MQSVRDVTYQLFRELGLTTIFGNVGSTEETFLKNFPKDFRYVLAPQEESRSGQVPEVRTFRPCADTSITTLGN
jgi:benzoylformate decarboxylase